MSNHCLNKKRTDVAKKNKQTHTHIHTDKHKKTIKEKKKTEN